MNMCELEKTSVMFIKNCQIKLLHCNLQGRFLAVQWEVIRKNWKLHLIVQKSLIDYIQHS